MSISNSNSVAEDLKNPVTKNVVEAATKGVEKAAERPNTLSATAIEESRRDIVVAVAKEVAPIIEHATNTEKHWVQKRTYWAAVVSLAATILAPMFSEYIPGVELLAADPANQEKIVTGILGIVSAYLSWRAGTAKKPIGPALP